MNRFEFAPSKTYATEANAVKAIEAMLQDGDKYMIVMDPTSKRFAPIAMCRISKGNQPAAYAFNGFTVVQL